MKYGTPNCPTCGEAVEGEVDIVPARSDVVQQDDGSFEYSGNTELFWESQVNERDWDARHPIARALAAALGNLTKMVEDGDYTTVELDEAKMALIRYAAATDTSVLVSVKCSAAHRWDTTREEML